MSLCLVFSAVLLGSAIGKVKIRHISLGLSGILFVAILLGLLLKSSALCESLLAGGTLQEEMKGLSSLGSALFVSVIGIHTGISLGSHMKRNLSAMAVGGGMSLAAALSALVIRRSSSAVSESALLGLLCGALTSTPALSAVCEGESIVASEAVVGYSCAYLFGVFAVVITVSLISSHSRKEHREEKKRQENGKVGFQNALLVFLAACLGRMVGKLEVPVLRLSLGSTGGMLCAGALLGVGLRTVKRTEQISPEALSLIREIGLSFFFAGTGIRAGMELVLPSGYWLLFGAVITSAALLFGLFSVTLLRGRGLSTASIVAGGMTSSPALGVLTEGKREVAFGQFSFSYFGAMITLLVVINLWTGGG